MGHPAILVVEDDDPLREALCDTLQLAGYQTQSAENGKAALRLLQDQAFAMVVSDVQMDQMDGHTLLRNIKDQYPDLPVLLMTAYGSIQNAVTAMREGATDYLVKPFAADTLVDLVTRLVSDKQVDVSNPVAASPRSREMLNIARRVAQSDATVLITGESGVGKEVMARYIHEHSARSNEAFIAINCAAIPDNMLEATLFGYEKGAFTGAYKSTAGKFEQAQNGTLLLDEITEMDLGLQAKILRVLQEREVERIGSNKLIGLNVRVLATSNRNLRAEVQAKRFREDLYYRLHVFPVHIPALRHRSEDIAPLSSLLLQRHAASYDCPAATLSKAALIKLQSHSWPGNIRELDNVLQRALIMQQGSEIDAENIHLEHMTENDVGEAAVQTDEQADANLSVDVKNHEFQLILQTLAECHGSKKNTARKLGVSERTLRYKFARMREAGIDIP